ncbi:Protein of uncharacterised function (DUF1294) [Shimwellia blattae]|nr:Protein of uncharacterised function (DUF1294) [Shimwellia blattae]VEC22640.1 Protein of uncharacterised function (DUF1294) [Shimwellia blattae]
MALAAIASAVLPYHLIAWGVFINLLTFLIYGGDKLAACKGWSRVPELTLLAFGLTGGWPGAIAGQHLFHHKTQKQPFKTWFWLSVVISLAAMAGGYWLYLFMQVHMR